MLYTIVGGITKQSNGKAQMELAWVGSSYCLEVNWTELTSCIAKITTLQINKAVLSFALRFTYACLICQASSGICLLHLNMIVLHTKVNPLPMLV